MESCFNLLIELERSGFLEQEDHCKTLVNVAKMRLVMTGVCSVINATVYENLEGGNAAKASRLLGRCVQVLERDPAQNDMKLFLVRVMAKMFSKDLVKEWGKSGKFSGNHMSLMKLFAFALPILKRLHRKELTSRQ